MRKIIRFLLFGSLFILPGQVGAEVSSFIIQRSDNNPVVAGKFIKLNIIACNEFEQVDETYTGKVIFSTNTGLEDITTQVPISAENFTIDPYSQNFIDGKLTTNVFCLVAADETGLIEITCRDSENEQATGSVELKVIPGEPKDIVIILPQQNYTPGVKPGFSPTENPKLLEGERHNVTVYVTDQYWNWAWNAETEYNIILSSLFNVAISPEDNNKKNCSNFEVEFRKMGNNQFVTAKALAANTETIEQNSYVDIFAIDQAYIHFEMNNEKIVAGEPFALTVTARSGQETNSPVVPSLNNTTLKLLLCLLDNDEAATGEWGPSRQITLGSTYIDNNGQEKFYGDARFFGDFTYSKAERIFLKVQVLNLPHNVDINITSLNSPTIAVLPNKPASIVTEMLPRIVSKEKTEIRALVLDQYSNPTRSSLYNNFMVSFVKLQGAGSLTVTEIATDDLGYAYSEFIAGNANEEFIIQVGVADYNVVNEFKGKISVTPPEPGKILNFPNPFNPAIAETTSINYYLGLDSDVEIRIYDAFGSVVLVKEFKKTDANQIARQATKGDGAAWEWDGKNGEGKIVGSGIYLVKIVAESQEGKREFKRRVGVLR